MTTSSENMETAAAGGTGMFLRKATGLVREVSVLDAVVLNSSGMNVGVGVALLFIWAPYLLTGGSIILATIIATLAVAFTTAYLYAVAAGAFPRSGADYVFTSRVLTPVWGFMLSGSQMLWNFFWMAFNAWALANFALPGTLQVLGEMTGNENLTALAGKVSQPAVVVGIAIVLQILFALLHIWGIKPYFTYLKITVGISVASVLLAILILIVQGANFQERWSAFMTGMGGLSYDQVISTAIAQGFKPDQPFSLGKTLAMMPLVFWIVGFFNGSPQIGGEVKRARSTQFIAMVGAVLINGGIVILLAFLVEYFIGRTFLASLGFLWFEHADLLGLGVTPDFNFLVSILSRSAPVVALLGLGYIFWATNGTPNIIAFVTRGLLAYSFDRMAPEALGEVSERYHTPVKAIIFTAAMGIVAIGVIVLVEQASLLSSMMAQMFAYLVISVAAIVFPFKYRKLWESTTSARKLFGIPIIAVAGAGSIIFTLLMSYFFAFYKMFNANSALSLLVVALTIIISAAYYYGYRAYQKSKGVDIDLIYKEIPPE
jgi:amino acid transporter